jgi:hypothetical protein
MMTSLRSHFAVEIACFVPSHSVGSGFPLAALVMVRLATAAGRPLLLIVILRGEEGFRPIRRRVATLERSSTDV